MRFPASIAAHRPPATFGHVAATIEADSEAEAVEIGRKLALRAYPPAEGWSGHGASVGSAWLVVDRMSVEDNIPPTNAVDRLA